LNGHSVHSADFAIFSSPSSAARDLDLRTRRPLPARPPSLRHAAGDGSVSSVESTASQSYLSPSNAIAGTSLLCLSPTDALELLRSNRRPSGGVATASPPDESDTRGDCLAKHIGDSPPVSRLSPVSSAQPFSLSTTLLFRSLRPAPNSFDLGRVAESDCPMSFISRARELRVSRCWRIRFEPSERGFVGSSKGLGFTQGTAMG